MSTLKASHVFRPLRIQGYTRPSLLGPTQTWPVPRPAPCLARLFATGSSPERTKPVIPLEPRPRSRFLHRSLLIAKYTSYLALSATAGVLALGAAIFIHDAFTYTDKHIGRVPVSPLALHPERGGPKNLPVVNALLADEEDEEFRKLNEKPRLVVVGGGWGVRLHTFPLPSLLNNSDPGRLGLTKLVAGRLPCDGRHRRNVHDVHSTLTM